MYVFDFINSTKGINLNSVLMINCDNTPVFVTLLKIDKNHLILKNEPNKSPITLHQFYQYTLKKDTNLIIFGENLGNIKNIWGYKILHDKNQLILN